jgi:hypothetical protein
MCFLLFVLACVLYIPEEEHGILEEVSAGGAAGALAGFVSTPFGHSHSHTTLTYTHTTKQQSNFLSYSRYMCLSMCFSFWLFRCGEDTITDSSIASRRKVSLSAQQKQMPKLFSASALWCTVLTSCPFPLYVYIFVTPDHWVRLQWQSRYMRVMACVDS